MWFGDPRQLLVERERIQRSVARAVIDGGLADLTARTDLELIDDEQRARSALASPAGVEFGLAVIRADRSRPRHHCRAVCFRSRDPSDGGPFDAQARLHLFALDHHRGEVPADATVLEPRPAPHQRAEGIELAEVGRRLDGSTCEPEPAGGVGVVDAAVTAVLLGVEHLCR